MEHKGIQTEREETKALMDKLRSEIIEIERQLRDAKNRLAVDGEYSDPDWYTRATYAHKIKKQMFQRLQDKLGELTRKQRDTRSRTLANHFIDIARRRLSEEAFTVIMDEAQEEADNQANA